MMAQIIANDRVDVVELDGRILIHHLFRGCAFLIRGDKCVERHASACDAINAVGVSSQRHWFSFDDECHGFTLARMP